jgi:hypothetical protein
MPELTHFLASLLSACGLTVLIVWPQDGPGAWLRERVVRRLLPGAAGAMLDCYICCGFWCGLILSPLWWHFYHEPWCWLGCLMVPALFWSILQPFR